MVVNDSQHEEGSEKKSVEEKHIKGVLEKTRTLPLLLHPSSGITFSLSFQIVDDLHNGVNIRTDAKIWI